MSSENTSKNEVNKKRKGKEYYKRAWKRQRDYVETLTKYSVMMEEESEATRDELTTTRKGLEKFVLETIAVKDARIKQIDRAVIAGQDEKRKLEEDLRELKRTLDVAKMAEKLDKMREDKEKQLGIKMKYITEEMDKKEETRDQQYVSSSESTSGSSEDSG